jgi:hypothetical protein
MSNRVLASTSQAVGMFIGFEGQEHTAVRTLVPGGVREDGNVTIVDSQPITLRIPAYAFCSPHVPLWLHSCLAAVTPSIALNYNEVKQVSHCAVCMFPFLHTPT